MSKFLNISTDTTLGGNSASDDTVSSQKAIKAYVDAHSGGGGSYTAGDGIDITNNVISVDGVQTSEITIDTTVTQNSSNLVTSGAVYNAVSESGGASRNIGEIVSSTIPLTDAGLHLLDGSLIQGGGAYSDFVDYIADLYNTDPTANYFMQGYSEVTSYNYTAVGTITNNNGVLSGFSNSNYATIPDTFSPSNNAWEFVIKITTGADVSTTQYILGREYYFDLYIGGGLIKTEIGNGSSWGITVQQGVTTLQANSTYYIKYIYTGSSYAIYLSTDGSAFSLEKSISYSTAQSSHVIPLGRIIATTLLNPFGGSIDLNGSYIKINNEIWWNGVTVTQYTPEEAWQNYVTNYGVCGKFVYDSVNNTVRLPKYSDKIWTSDTSGTAEVRGNGMTLGLTDGITNYGMYLSYGSTRNTLPANAYGTPIGSSASGENSNSLTVGVTTDGSKSGIVADLSGITSPIDGYWYIVVATSTKTQIEVDIDEVMTDLNGKADADLSNCTKPHIVETYVNGTSWYRVYSDGWCEQGGFTNPVSADYQVCQIVFLKPFIDTNYYFNSRYISTSWATATVGVVSDTDRQTTGVKIWNYSQYSSGAYWQACGYIS